MMHTELTDKELTLRVKEHNEVAFETLFRRYSHYLYTIAIQYVKDPALAEDAIQEVFLKVWTNRESLDETQSIRSYLATATRHQIVNLIRNEKRAILRHLNHQTTLTNADTATEETLLLNEYSSVFLEGLRQLSAQRRLVFTLRSEQGLSNEEVASTLKVSINTVKVQYYQACRFLRDYLRQHAGIEATLVVIAAFWS
ncbi:RNA polymerase sigma factor [Spirosoma aerophilum]